MNKGRLYLIGTPIGNYNDITYRALEILKKVDLLLCEDIRETSKLLDNFLIKKELISYIGSSNLAYKKTQDLINIGKNVGLVSDRGMPCISDPGADFIRYFRNLKFEIEIIPGVSAVTTAFTLAGKNGGFYFYGFLPKKKNSIKSLIIDLLKLETTLIFFESPYRIKNTLKIISEIIPNKEIQIMREMTKTYKEHLVGTAKELMVNEIKGELVLII